MNTVHSETYTMLYINYTSVKLGKKAHNAQISCLGNRGQHCHFLGEGVQQTC